MDDEKKAKAAATIGWTCAKGHKNMTPRTPDDMFSKPKAPLRCATPGCGEVQHLTSPPDRPKKP